MNVFQFMSDHPILTFFLACIACEALVGMAKGLRGR